jgi:methylenetetrahydrofolate reductase (NADPH)
MNTFRQKIESSRDFLIGVELVTTRGTMKEVKARQTRALASELTHCDAIDWVSITDNAGGNPMLSPVALGKNILYGGKDVLIHLSCKDFNRHGLESEAWSLASEGFQNILALSGDYPAEGYRGRAKSVFDIDSVGLLTLLDEMNSGLGRPTHAAGDDNGTYEPTEFFLGGVATNFKRYENEVMPQYLKLQKKIEAGARFIIAQIGFDARKSHEMLVYLQEQGQTDTALIGNVFLMSLPVARFFRSQKIPGVVISDEFLNRCQSSSQSPDRGRAHFRELAAQQIAIFRGLGFRGAYLGGVHTMDEINAILEMESSFAADDWQQFAGQLQYPLPNEFYLYERDPDTKLADSNRKNREYLASRQEPRRANRNVTLGYRFSKWMHHWLFTPGTRLFRLAKKIYGSARNPDQGPAALRILEHASKSAMFGCKDCGDCSLPDIAFLCPESQCAKNQRNGPCGGTRDGKCEVDEFECIWSRAYDRLKYEGREQELLEHAPVIQDESLRGTSSWGNVFLGRDHHANKIGPSATAYQKDAYQKDADQKDADQHEST